MGLLLVWNWVKRYWKWLLFPIGILLFLLGRFTIKKPTPVIAPELVRASEEEKKAREEAEKRALAAELERERKLLEINAKHEETLKKMTDEQKHKAKELEAQPEKLNEFLLEVGKQIRG